jgi:hypothetical protein
MVQSWAMNTIKKLFRSVKARVGLAIWVGSILLKYGSNVLDWIGRLQTVREGWSHISAGTIGKFGYPALLVLGIVLVISAVYDVERRGHPIQKSLQMSPSDPLVYFDIERRQDMTNSTPLVLHNRGASVAHRIRILPLQLGRGAVTFKEIDYIDVGKKCESMPSVEFAHILWRNNLLNALHDEANAMGQGDAKEFVKTIQATYENVSGRQFRVSFDLVYSPLNKMLFDNHQGSPMAKFRPICEVKNTKIVRC